MTLHRMHTKVRYVLRRSCGEVEGRGRRTPGSRWDAEHVYSTANRKRAAFHTRWEAKADSQGYPLTSNMGSL